MRVRRNRGLGNALPGIIAGRVRHAAHLPPALNGHIRIAISDLVMPSSFSSCRTASGNR